MDSHAVLECYRDLEIEIEALASAAAQGPKLGSATEVAACIVPPSLETPAPSPVPAADREQMLGRELRNEHKPVTMARHINLALADIMLQYPNTVVFGEDVAAKGGVYGITQGLLDKFGANRVTNTPLDEQSILGLAIGLAHAGYLPIAEIQYLAYLHNAEDQLRGEAATLSFFSSGQFTNPMVIRIAGFGYQKGFGGHFHNDNAIAVLRDIPGIIVVTASQGCDAAELLRCAVELARKERRVVIFIEPIARYMTQDLHAQGDGQWLSPYRPPAAGNTLAFGDMGQHGSGRKLCLLSYANGYYLCRQAAQILQQEHQVELRVVDIRWLQPLPEAAILAATHDCECALVVDECRRSGSVSEAISTLLYEHQTSARLARVTAQDSFIPLGDAAQLMLPSVGEIVEASLDLLAAGSP